MDKPFILRFFTWLARGLGREKFLQLQYSVYRASLGRGSQRAEVERLLSRVLRFTHREPSPSELQRLIDEMAWIFSDMLTTLYLIEPGALGGPLERIDLQALPELARLRQAGKGVILAGPHFGNVALAMAGLAQSSIPLTTILINADPYRWIESFGLHVVSLGEAAVDCVRALNANEAVLILADLDFFPEGRTADFFGAPMRPPHGAARLSLACGAPILPVYTVHQGAGRYRLECDKPIMPEPGSTIESLEERLLRSMEDYIGRYPSQWLVLRDIWDIERCDKLNARHLANLALWRSLFGRP